jgi:hypothetical protein
MIRRKSCHVLQARQGGNGIRCDERLLPGVAAMPSPHHKPLGIMQAGNQWRVRLSAARPAGLTIVRDDRKLTVAAAAKRIGREGKGRIRKRIWRRVTVLEAM